MTKLIITQIIKPEEQDNYQITIYENMKNKIVVVTKTLEYYNKSWLKKLFMSMDQDGKNVYVILFDECNLKEGDIIDVELKPFLVDAKYFEVKN